MSVRLAGVLRTARPEVRRCRVTVLAADNGVVAEGVSCAPQSVTVQQAVNMTRHKTGTVSYTHLTLPTIRLV